MQYCALALFGAHACAHLFETRRQKKETYVHVHQPPLRSILLRCRGRSNSDPTPTCTWLVHPGSIFFSNWSGKNLINFDSV